MRLYGLLSIIEVKKFPRFDVNQKTGEVFSDPMYILQGVVSDLDNPQSVFQCTFNEGFGVEDLRAACKAKAPEAERDVLSANVNGSAKVLQGQQVALVVKSAKVSKGFLSFSVGFEQQGS